MPLDCTLSAVSALTAFLGRAKPPRVEAVGAWGSGKTLLAVQAARALGRPLLMVSMGRQEAESIHDDLATFAGEEHTALFPAWEVLPTDTMNPADDIVAERMNALKRMAAALEAGETMFVSAPIRSIVQYVIARKRLAQDVFTLETGAECDLDDLLERLIKLGYEREVMVERRGEVSVRGGIVDIFPISSELPIRIELFGDEIESIRQFEPETQRSVISLDKIELLPRSEKNMLARLAKEKGGLAPLSSYFPEGTLVAFDEPLAIEAEAERLDTQFAGNPYHLPWAEARAHLDNFPRLDLVQVGGTRAEGVERVRAPMQSLSGWAGQSDEFWKQLKQWDLEGYRVRLLCVNTGERNRLLELIAEQGYRPGQDAFDLDVSLGRLRSGFVVPEDKLAVLSEREIFGRHYMRRTRRRFEAGAAIAEFTDLKAGDYIVHVVHGIGRYFGLRRFEGKAGDFMAIQYSGGDTVYVPVSHIDQVQKYVAHDGAMPKIDKIGGASWARAKARVKKAVKDITADLVQLYAQRAMQRGHAHAPDTPWQREFEDAFEYEETPDQRRAIKDVKTDMEQRRPMDRLLCGDVGYGKTEVALRAAFKTVMDGKQAAILAPTTVLAQQHYNTFKERLADFPIRVDLMNRFRTDSQQNATLRGLADGAVNVVVGTHRLASHDIIFKDLGLLIIDEEQRFGVEVKERIKKLRSHVDVLAMSATPIPRTLHMSLIGVRDMSLINTAPNDRLPIHTCVESWDENIIREAIERELGREGQVFYLHNRVQTIDQVAAQIHKLVPSARIAIGHGQMAKHELEDVMTAFVNHEKDVLVCTTIIGSGIDIPNVNTIIIDRADTFGLAELYQIRGRVGRYKHRAFAYLLVPGEKALTEEAQQRLKALEEFSALGSGFRIAMRDLEIRGCGNILGGEQSGHIAAVGYETYRMLIEEAVAELKGQPLERRSLPPFDIAVDAHIPDDYVPVNHQKMNLYRRISTAQSLDELAELRAELRDRYGAPPKPVQRLLDVMRARALAADLGIAKFAASASQGVSVAFESGHPLNRATVRALESRLGGQLSLAWHDAPGLLYKPAAATAEPLRETLHLLEALAEAAG